MSFTSAFYLPFLALAVVAWFAVRRWGRAPLVVLSVSSLAFYATWNPLYCLALLGTVSLDWWVGRRLGAAPDPRARKRLVVLSLVYNLGTLAGFKYFNLLADTAQAAVRGAGGELDIPLRIVFAVGISFYTFQSLSYVIDVYRGDQDPCGSWLEYLSFVAFFPTLLAGPITRAETLLPQLARPPRALSDEQAGQAFFLLALGFAKKGAADYLALNLVSRVFDLPGMYSSAEILAGIYGYAAQIYLDFSGYSDIAIGSALLLGIRLKDNFNFPYRASDLAEFWRRWHISLSTWLRDYLFFALPGKDPRTPWPYLNLVITFALGGLWHGAAWTFLVWGALHGVGLAVVRLVGGRPGPKTAWRTLGGAVLTFHFVAFTWLLFRCETLGEAGSILALLARGTPAVGNVPLAAALLIAAVLALQWVPEGWFGRAQRVFVELPALAQAACLLALAAALRLAAGSAPSPFIYFSY